MLSYTWQANLGRATVKIRDPHQGRMLSGIAYKLLDVILLFKGCPRADFSPHDDVPALFQKDDLPFSSSFANAAPVTFSLSKNCRVSCYRLQDALILTDGVDANNDIAVPLFVVRNFSGDNWDIGAFTPYINFQSPQLAGRSVTIAAIIQ